MTSPFSFAGLRIQLDPHMSDHAGWDFSRCRSPSRAMRRWRAGIPSKMVREIRTPKQLAVKFGDTLIMHPAIWAQVEQKLPRQPLPSRGLW